MIHLLKVFDFRGQTVLFDKQSRVLEISRLLDLVICIIKSLKSWRGTRADDGGALHYLDAGLFHSFDGVFAVVGLEVQPAAGVFAKPGLEALPRRVQRGVFAAIICRKTAYINFGHITSLEPFRQARRFAMAVVKHPAVTVDAGIGAFEENFG